MNGFQEQTQSLRKRLADIIKNKLDIKTKGVTFQQLDWAVTQLQTSPTIPLDFVDPGLFNFPFPQDITQCLVAFFKVIYKRMKKDVAPHEPFDQAFLKLQDKLYSICQHKFMRELRIEQITSSHKTSFAAMIDRMGPLMAAACKEILTLMPCSDKHPKHQVICHQVQGELHEHKSTVSRPRGGIMGLFNSTPKLEPINWEGPFIPSGKPYALAVAIPDDIAITRQDIRGVQASFLDDPIFQVPCPEVCLGCVIQAPTERIFCGHLLCLSCCKENQIGAQVKCPCCLTESLWAHTDPPEGAGYRVLSLDAGGIRGVVTAMMLVQVETLIGISIANLFDLIVGSGSGGLIALSHSEGRSSEQLLFLFRDIGKNGFVPLSLLGISIPSSLLWYKYKRRPLSKVLSVHFSGKLELAGVSSTRVAVVGGIPRPTPSVCLFSSYCPVVKDEQNRIARQISGSVAEVAELFGAGIFFNVIWHLLFEDN